MKEVNTILYEVQLWSIYKEHSVTLITQKYSKKGQI